MQVSRLFHSRTGFRWLVIPFLLLLIIFWVVPLIQGGISSLQPDFPKEGEIHQPLDNYRKVIGDPNFKKASSNTSRYIFYCLVSIIPLSLFLAFLLMRITDSAVLLRIKKVSIKIRPRYFAAFCLLIPSLIPPAVIGLLFNMTFNGRTGILNQIFVLPFGGKVIDWMNNPNYILSAMVIQSIWRWTGFTTLFLLCGLEAVPKNVKEAARLEGAGPIRQFLHIELPAIQHLIFFCMAFLFIDSFSLFSGAYSLMGPSGGSANAGLVMINYAYQFNKFQQYNVAAAVCICMLPVLMFITGLFCINWRKALFKNGTSNWMQLCFESFCTFFFRVYQALPSFIRSGLESLKRVWSKLTLATPKSLRRAVVQLKLFAVMLPFMIIFIYPVVWLIISSFKSNREMYKPMQLLPKKWNTDAWQLFFSDKFNQDFTFWTYWNNSMLIAVGQAVLAVMISAAAAYFFVFKKFKGRYLLFILAVSLILVPRQILIFPLRELVFKMGIYDNLWAVILPGALSGIGILFFIQIYKGLPRDYVDMARIEGASELRTFSSTIPLLMSAFLCCFMIHFLLAWQQHLIPLQLLNDNMTLPVAMSAISSSGGGIRYPVAILLISAIFCIIPCIMIFLFTYRKFRSALSGQIV